jgi:hypothetical protein
MGSLEGSLDFVGTVPAPQAVGTQASMRKNSSLADADYRALAVGLEPSSHKSGQNKRRQNHVAIPSGVGILHMFQLVNIWIIQINYLPIDSSFWHA